MEYEHFISYSSYGEDSIFNGILRRLSWIMQENLFETKTYIDVGAFHPVRESNTYFLYKQGWHGTLVEPNSYFNILTHELRSRDILYNCAVDVEPGTQTLYMFGNMDSSNTLSEDFAKRKQESQHTSVGWTAEVETKTLDDITKIHTEYFKQNPFFLNIDIEGMDYKVMNSYSFDIRPPFIMIEDDSNNIFNRSPIRSFMRQKDYIPVATTFLTTLYIDQSSRYHQHLHKIGSFEE